jgi:hypothetical protein
MLYTYTQIDAQLVAGFYRDPDWRDARARRLCEEGRVPSPRVDDETTIQLTDFYRQRELCRTEYDFAAVYQGASHVSEAVQMHELSCGGPGCVLEALVLAAETSDRIATRMRTTTEVVKFYENAFWDIRSRLSDHDFIVSHCIGLQNAGANGHQFGCAATRFFAYLTGKESIDLFAFPTGAPNRWQSMSELVSAIGRRARLLLGVGALEDGQFTDPRARRDLLRVIESLDEQSNNNFGDERAPKTKDERIVAGLLEAMGNRVPGAPFRR